MKITINSIFLYRIEISNVEQTIIIIIQSDPGSKKTCMMLGVQFFYICLCIYIYRQTYFFICLYLCIDQ